MHWWRCVSADWPTSYGSTVQPVIRCTYPKKQGAVNLILAWDVLDGASIRLQPDLVWMSALIARYSGG